MPFLARVLASFGKHRPHGHAMAVGTNVASDEGESRSRKARERMRTLMNNSWGGSKDSRSLESRSVLTDKQKTKAPTEPQGEGRTIKI